MTFFKHVLHDILLACQLFCYCFQVKIGLNKVFLYFKALSSQTLQTTTNRMSIREPWEVVWFKIPELGWWIADLVRQDKVIDHLHEYWGPQIATRGDAAFTRGLATARMSYIDEHHPYLSLSLTMSPKQWLLIPILSVITCRLLGSSPLTSRKWDI